MLWSKLSLFSALAVLLGTPVRSCDIDAFAREKLTLFSSWLLHNYDPSPHRDGPDTFSAVGSVTSLQLEIRNHGIMGHSNDLSIKWCNPKLLADNTAIINTEFILSGNITFYGEYAASGTINSQPVSVQGEWHISMPKLIFTFYGLEFGTSSDGFMQIIRHGRHILYTSKNDVSVYFRNLSDHQAAVCHKEEISKAIHVGFQKYLNEDAAPSNHPFRKGYLQYWEDILAETRYEDINDRTEL